MIATPLKALAAAALTVSAMSWPSGHVQPNTNAVQQEVSAAEIDRTLRAIDVDRTSGSEGERASWKYLDRRLAEYGIAHMLYDSHLYLSWPGRAELVVPALGTIRGKTAAFAAATPKDGLRGRVVFEPKLTRRVDQSLAFDSDVRGRTCAESPTRRRSCSPASRLARSLFYTSIERQMQLRRHEGRTKNTFERGVYQLIQGLPQRTRRTRRSNPETDRIFPPVLSVLRGGVFIFQTRSQFERERHRLNCIFSDRSHSFRPLAIDGIVRRSVPSPAGGCCGSC